MATRGPLRGPDRTDTHIPVHFVSTPAEGCSISILLYLRNGARQGHSNYGRLIGIRMRTIERRYFQ